MLESERLLYRPWTPDDAEAMYGLAKDPEVGPNAGWPAHTSVDESRKIIESVFSAPETYAIMRKLDGVVIGSVGLTLSPFGIEDESPSGSVEGIGSGTTAGSVATAEPVAVTNPATQATEGASCYKPELGYWIGRAYWGHGYATEAARFMLERAFRVLGYGEVICRHYAENERSRRVIEKCGFNLIGENPNGETLLGYTLPELEYTLSREHFEEISSSWDGGWSGGYDGKYKWGQRRWQKH